MVRGGSMTVSRIPSLHFLHAQLPLLEGDSEGTYRAGVDPRSAFYVVDPENNLMKTQDCFRDLFARWVITPKYKRSFVMVKFKNLLWAKFLTNVRCYDAFLRALIKRRVRFKNFASM